MKKILNKIFPFVLISFFLACDPIERREDLGGGITSAEQIKATVTQVIVGNTQKTNKVRVHCSSPVLCQWTDGVKTYASSDTAVTLFVTGNQTITLTTRNADGAQFTKAFSVTIDTLYYPVPLQYSLFCGTGTKTWAWATDIKTDSHRIWGNGSAKSDTLPTWWGRTAIDADQDGIDINGQMIFDLIGMKFTRIENGVTTKGTFAFDMTTHKTAMGIGQLTITGTTILQGISQNDDKKVVYVFDIVKLTSDELVLLYPTDKAPNNTWPEGWFWLFKRSGFTY